MKDFDMSKKRSPLFLINPLVLSLDEGIIVRLRQARWEERALLL